MNRKSQQGVALVITLIMLSVITFMAVTFLVISRHDSAQVDTVTQQSNAKFSAEAALEEAKAQIIAGMTATPDSYSNAFAFSLLVSTNFVQPIFSTAANPYTNLYNVSYNLPNGATVADLEQMENNLLVLPRAPVFVKTNFNDPGEFRYYLDLNRNGVYDTNGVVRELDGNNNVVFNSYVGDPEWVGILDHPDNRHSASNFFIGRYCFIALPVGNTLDINYIHNQAKLPGNVWGNGFGRNQGVGTWEINLAGFLHELNPAGWDTVANFNYGTTPLNLDSGSSFDDATSILNYRYNNNWANLQNIENLYQNVGMGTWSALVDIYTAGTANNPRQYMTGPFLNRLYKTNIYANTSWSGAENPNHYYSAEDYFTKVPNPLGIAANSGVAFTNTLVRAGKNFGYTFGLTNQGGAVSYTNSLNRYTFYRMLAQMGMETTPEPDRLYPTNNYTRKMNLNFDDVTPYVTNTFTYAPSATNFLEWAPLTFFTNAADRMLRATFPNPFPVATTTANVYSNYFICITNIPIYPTNLYTPSVHRLLQLAANMYDSTTTNIYPSVFRPVFSRGAGPTGFHIWISGYVYVANTNDNSYLQRPLSLPEDIGSIFATSAGGTTNIYGIPWVIGAKKGFPNFNRMDIAYDAQLGRKLQIVKTSPSVVALKHSVTNVQYTVGVSNALSIQAWNSYSNAYPRDILMYAANTLTLAFSNDTQILTNIYSTNVVALFIPSNTWGGFNPNVTNPKYNSNSFRFPLTTNYVMLPFTNGVYHPFSTPKLTPGTNFDVTGTTPAALLPNFYLNFTNRIQFVMIDSGHIIDYVQLGGKGMDFTNDLTTMASDLTTGGNKDSIYLGVWKTNLVNGMPQGFINQLQVSQLGTSDTLWANDSVEKQVKSAISGFTDFMTGSGQSASNQAPFSVTIKIRQKRSWQANDPLVHYSMGDLDVPPPPTVANDYYYGLLQKLTQADVPITTNVTKVNDRYQPWGNLGNDATPDTTNICNIAVKDSGIVGSDSWQFTTNKYPTVGWLGRVHRGTPWQTVFLKPTNAVFTPGSPNTNFHNLANWEGWSGDTVTNIFLTRAYTNQYNNVVSGYPDARDAYLTQPFNDWALLDLFTTSPNDAASRGQLSINQTNVSAWAAVLDGVNVLNSTGGNSFISPYDVAPDGSTMNYYFANKINSYRATPTASNQFGVATNWLFPGQVFTSVGQILGVKELTVNSPYLDTNNLANLRDEVYERIPQQIMSLLRVGTPRYVIFAYGQSLKPAPNSIVQSGKYFGMCTNYQITGEVATRAVVRFENTPVPGQTGNPPAPRAVVESFNVMGPD